MIASALFSSERPDWGTPRTLFEQLHHEFSFTVDLAAHRSNHKLPRWFGPGGEHEDAFAVPWAPERCWLNPPYGREVGNWLKRAAAESERGALVVCLLPARTDTAWFHDHVQGQAEVRFLRGRLRFEGASSSAPFPSLIAVYGSRGSREVRL